VSARRTRRDRAQDALGRPGAVTIAALITIAIGASCGYPTESEPRAVGLDAVPAPLQPGATPPTTAVASSEAATVWLVRDGSLAGVVRQVPIPVEAGSVVASLAAGPTEEEQTRRLRSAIPDASVVVEAVTSRGVATVELAPGFSDIPPADQVLAIGQLVLTLTDLRGIGRVRFAVDGAPIAVPLPDGTASEEPVSRDDFIELATARLG